MRQFLFAAVLRSALSYHEVQVSTLAARKRRSGAALTVLLLLAALISVGCGGGGAPKPPVVQPGSLAVYVLGTSASSANGTIMAVDPKGLPLTYAITEPPTVGRVSLDAASGAFTYRVAGYTAASTDVFTVSVSNGSVSTTARVWVQLGIDPLLPQQWHIQNTGQNVFSSTLPIAGNDMNVSSAWAAGFSGKGIKVGVVDTGLEAAHEDLAANVDISHSFNFLTGGNDPTPAATLVGPDHGTSVAGIIGAVAFNGKGGRGVAYKTRLRGYNSIAKDADSVENMAKSLGSDPISADNDVFNGSFGSDAQTLPTVSEAYQSITQTSLTLRNGLGAAIVKAAGNEFSDWTKSDTGLCVSANLYNVSCGDPAIDELDDYVPIIVGALDGDGTRSSYSSTGSSLWISAPAGEWGWDSSYAQNTNLNVFKPAIITTARTGCANADYPADYPNGINALDSKGKNPLATSCQYTAGMSGTSSATPNTAAAVALMLEANPKLTVRDIKYILAKTAKKVDPAFPGVSSNNIIAGATMFLEQPWVTNGAGWSFSNWYGFGAVDAASAVSMARSYSAYLPAMQSSTGNYSVYATPPATVPAYSATGASFVFHVSESFNSTEAVMVFVNVAATPGLRCNQVELTSPSGTKSILMHAENGFNNSSVVNSRLLSNAFYGEPVNGDWTLKFFDFCEASATPTQLSTTQPQKLQIIGH